MIATTSQDKKVEAQEEIETHSDRLLRIAEAAKEAKSNGGQDLASMTREKRRQALFGR